MIAIVPVVSMPFVSGVTARDAGAEDEAGAAEADVGISDGGGEQGGGTSDGGGEQGNGGVQGDGVQGGGGEQSGGVSETDAGEPDVGEPDDDTANESDEDQPKADYFSTHFGLRTQLIALDAELKSRLFGESSNQKVVEGRDGWLFLAETLDPDTPGNQASDRAAARIARTLWLFSEYLEQNGADFLFVAAPNKAGVYPEYLPYYMPRPGLDGARLLDRVQLRIDALGVRYIDLSALFQQLREKDDGTYYYHQRDTHWNNRGALEVYRTIMAELESMAANADIESVTASAAPESTAASAEPESAPGAFAYERYESLVPRVAVEWDGDLEDMLNPLSERLDTQFFYDVPKEYSARKPIVNTEDMNIETTSKKNGVRALIFRDSFANALIQFFTNNLGKASFTRSMPFPLSRAEGGAYDVVILEIVERNLRWIVDAAPAIPAPEISEPESERVPAEQVLAAIHEAGQFPADAVIFEAAEAPTDGRPSPGARFYGCFDPALLTVGAETRIYPVVEGANGEVRVFEAFPILEKNVLDAAIKRWGAAAEDCGFSFYLDSERYGEHEAYTVRLLLAGQGSESASGGVGAESGAARISEPLFTANQ
ncbi:MAG: hypothetical protein LBU58_09630 [Clostridiales bacterium]|nr:hypothetical protein [Clostridiales bacterium]